MTRLLVTCLAIIGLLFVSWTPAAADTYAYSSAVYDTVDAIEVRGLNWITVTGIIAGQGAPSTLTYQLEGGSYAGTDAAARCDRLALLAMSKPGKFQLVMKYGYLSGLDAFSCKLIVRTP